MKSMKKRKIGCWPVGASSERRVGEKQGVGIQCLFDFQEIQS
jgi:hypothetical protein